jgi:hypothetical protein
LLACCFCEHVDVLTIVLCPLALSNVRALQAGVLSKEREAKILKFGFTFDGK